MKTFRDMLFGGNLVCLLWQIAKFTNNTATEFNYFALAFLIIYFLLEIPRRITEHYKS